MKKVLKTTLAVALLSSSLVYSQAFATDQKNEPAETPVITSIQGKKVVKQTELSRAEIEKLAKQYGQDPNKILGATYYQYEGPSQINSISATSASSSTYLKNIQASPVGGNIFQRDMVFGPAAYKSILKSTFSTEVSNELTLKTGLSVSEMSGKLGVKYTVNQEFSREYSVNVPADKRYTVYAAPNYNEYTYEVWKTGWFSDTYLGSFYLKDPMGVTVWHQDTTGW